MKKYYFIFLIIFLLTIQADSDSSDWPVYKGNIYFTGNNDEIIVKNNNLKWLFQGDDRVFNPVVSDDKIYFTDAKSNVYCLDEEYGKLVWKINLKQISAQFRAFSRSAGKVKYPLIKGNTLFLSDPIAIYAINKNNGRVLWARTGMRQENLKPDLSGRLSSPMVDGIYADPVILENNIFYGTRNTFISREIRNGHENWTNDLIKTYSGFPTFYDDLIFSQSMDYGKGKYTVHCLKADTGKEIWSQSIKSPLKIYPPVVYKEKVYIPSGKSIYCLDLKTGEKIWIKEYTDLITSSLSFTDRSILFSISNSDIAVIDPGNGNIIRIIKTAPQSGPYFVTINDQIYIAYNKNEYVNSKKVPYGMLKAVNLSDNNTIWDYKTPFPGAVSQPSASNGILFLPAGNYLYAIGTEYYNRIVDGGSGYAIAPGQEKHDKDKTEPLPEQPRISGEKPPAMQDIKTRKLKVSVTDKDGKEIPAVVGIRKREKGKTVYSKQQKVDKTGIIDVPEGDGIELLFTSPGYVPRKEIVKNDEKTKNVILDKIAPGKSYTVGNIFFELDQAYLKKESIDILDKLIMVMKENPNLKVEVRGYTDSTGDEDHNQKLSEKRADAVIEYMIKNGISPERLDSKGFGEKNPIASNDTEEGRRKNRRTEFYFKK